MDTRQRRRSGVPYLLLIPAVVILLAALAYPVGWQIVTSFQKFRLMQVFNGSPEFAGLNNYIEIITNPRTWGVLVRSVLFCLVNAALTVLIGTLLALLMNAVAKSVRLILQIALLLAWAMPVVAAMTVWNWLFDRQNGVINWVVTNVFGVQGYAHHNWLEQPMSFYAVATVVVVWMSVPFVAFSMYAGLTQVSPEILEAAAIDGTTRFQRFAHIILPMVRPVLMIVLLLQVIWDLRVFTQIRMLQDRGSNPRDTDLIGTFIYREATSGSDFSKAAAMSVLVLIITIALSAFYVRSLVREEEAS